MSKFTRESLLQYHAQMSERARVLMAAKNHDYAGHEGIDPFANFRRAEDMGITSTGQALLVRMTDKFSRLATFCQGGVLKVQDEKVDDTCLDLVNYSILFAALVLEEKENGSTTKAAGEANGCAPTSQELLVQIMHALEELSKRLCDG